MFSQLPDNFITRPSWDVIRETKDKFLETGQLDTAEDTLDAKIVDSWRRSKEYGLLPDSIPRPHVLSEEESLRIREQHEMLIQQVDEIFDSLYSHDVIMANSAYGFYLFDPNSTLLLTNGDALLWTESKPKVLSVWDERSMGTSAHVIALRHAQSISVFGPEHYLAVLDYSVVVSVPLLNEDGVPYAAISVSRHLSDWECQYDDKTSITSHLYGVANTVAAAIGGRVRTQLKERQMRHAFVSIVEELEQGEVVVDKHGVIRYQNMMAEGLLGLETEDRITDSPWDWREVKTAIMQNKEIMTNITIKSNQYRVSVRPFYNKVVQETDTFLLTFKRVSEEIEKVKHKQKVLEQSDVVSGSGFTFSDMIGTSKALHRAINKAKTFSYLEESILLLGESGTGKELFAKAIHSDYRPEGPFIAINCGAMPHNLIESELFGYEGGSFTSANRHGRAGKIELAQGGTLFLDEIGDMPIDLQAVLLRVLQDKKIMRIGGNQYIDVDFRLIAATNKNIQEMVRNGAFREDLFYRLSALSVSVPPLRERNGDVELLFRHYMMSYAEKYAHLQNTTFRIHPEVINAIYEYDWPGNVRELQNAVVYAVAVSKGGDIAKESLPQHIIERKPPLIDTSTIAPEKMYSLDFLERLLIQNALFYTKNNIAKASSLLGISRSTLYRKLKEYNLSADE